MTFQPVIDKKLYHVVYYDGFLDNLWPNILLKFGFVRISRNFLTITVLCLKGHFQLRCGGATLGTLKSYILFMKELVKKNCCCKLELSCCYFVIQISSWARQVQPILALVSSTRYVNNEKHHQQFPCTKKADWVM